LVLESRIHASIWGAMHRGGVPGGSWRPQTGQLHAAIAASHVRVRRGGSWHTWSFYARSSFRNWNTSGTRYTLVGMRLLREAD
jgi:formylglycine-generating enzyme required for sulfatase activity